MTHAAIRMTCFEHLNHQDTSFDCSAWRDGKHGKPLCCSHSLGASGLGLSKLSKELNVPLLPQERQCTAVKVPGNLSVPRIAVCVPVWVLEAKR